jgi:hypothetical protein
MDPMIGDAIDMAAASNYFESFITDMDKVHTIKQY